MGETKKNTNSHDLLSVEIRDNQWPIIYSNGYQMTFLGLEKLHPFDASKWRRIREFLIEGKLLTGEDTVEPKEANTDDLLICHEADYINSLRWSIKVARCTEMPFLAALPNFLVQRRVLRPMRLQTGGSVLAASFALGKQRWALNLGGGYHHACGANGGGFCVYADITLAVRYHQKNGRIKKAMIIDLDAHQGNGHERDFLDDPFVHILDVYNREIYPHDTPAKRAISNKVELRSFTDDDQYLPLVRAKINESLAAFTPDLIIYNAGTDILDGDPLGMLSVSAEGIKLRDRIVFEAARERDIPIVMLTSGGYQYSNARIIADSILDLAKRGLISRTGPVEQFAASAAPSSAID